jgi:hypothetical protein
MRFEIFLSVAAVLNPLRVEKGQETFFVGLVMVHIHMMIHKMKESTLASSTCTIQKKQVDKDHVSTR